MDEQEYYLPLRVKPSGNCHCHRTCKSLYSIEADECNSGTRMYFCTFCDHAMVEVCPGGELLRLDYCRQYTTAGTELPSYARFAEL